MSRNTKSGAERHRIRGWALATDDGLRSVDGYIVLTRTRREADALAWPGERVIRVEVRPLGRSLPARKTPRSAE